MKEPGGPLDFSRYVDQWGIGDYPLLPKIEMSHQRLEVRIGHRWLGVGDVIRCADKEDMVNTMMDLQKAGIDTEFKYERDGEEGLWLVVTKIEASTKENGNG